VPLQISFNAATQTGDLVENQGLPLVQVAVGGAKPAFVVLDTASVGLRMLASAMPTDQSGRVTDTHRSAQVTFGDGTTLSGTTIEAKVTVGGLTTRSAVPIQRITSVTCSANRPDCPKLGQLPGMPRIAGILGIGLSGSSEELSNPLLSLPAPYDQTWSIAMGGILGNTGQLTLDATVPDRPAVRLALTRKDTGTQPGTAWNDQPNLCWRLGSHQECGPTTFESGASDTIITGDRHAMTASQSALPVGEHLRLLSSNLKRPLWSLTSGYLDDIDRVFDERDLGPSLNTGIAFFYAYTVTYDAGKGVIAFVRNNGF
jgi:hypothetical protein